MSFSDIKVISSVKNIQPIRQLKCDICWHKCARANTGREKGTVVSKACFLAYMEGKQAKNAVHIPQHMLAFPANTSSNDLR